MRLLLICVSPLAQYSHADNKTVTFFFQFDKRGATRSGAFDYTIGGRPSSRPFSVNPAYNNLTYASLNEEKYRDFLDGRYMGEIWSATLFELMWELADKHNMGDLHEPTEGCVFISLRHTNSPSPPPPPFRMIADMLGWKHTTGEGWPCRSSWAA